MDAPRLTFCCELPTDRLVELFGDPAVLADLVALRACVSLALLDLSAERAAVVRRLNDAGVPVSAWLLVSEEDGYFCHLDNAPAVAGRYDAFKAWVAAHALRIGAVALDIEPDVRELRQLGAGRRAAVVRTWLRRVSDRGRLRRGLAAYQQLIARMRADGLRTECYRFPVIADEERAAGSTLLQRLFGVMDLRVDREWLTVYTTFLKQPGVGMLWHYARSPGTRLVPVVGDTAGVGLGPALAWDGLARDLRLARRWGDEIGIYSLEGCVTQGLLPRLRAFDWSQPGAQPAAARPIAAGLAALRVALWAASHPRATVAAAPPLLRLLHRLLAHPRLAAALAGGAFAYHRLLRPRLRSWGATSAEAAATLPGDDLIPRPRLQHTRAVTICACAEAVWPWLVQMGFRRGGYYYPGWLDAVWGWLIRRRYRHEPWYTEESVVNVNADRVVPELQDLRVGDRLKDGPDGYFEVRELIPDRALVLYSARHPLSGRPVDPRDPGVGPFVDFSWSFVLHPVDAQTTRLLARLRADHSPGPPAAAAVYVLLEPIDWLMQAGMLGRIKTLVERTPPSPAITPSGAESDRGALLATA